MVFFFVASPRNVSFFEQNIEIVDKRQVILRVFPSCWPVCFLLARLINQTIAFLSIQLLIAIIIYPSTLPITLIFDSKIM